MNKSIRSRAWMVTISLKTGPGRSSYERGFDGMIETKELSFAVVGFEVSKSGYEHLQCYVEMHTKVSFSTIQKLFPKHHVTVRRGSQKQAIECCEKEGDFKRYGTPMMQGHADSNKIKKIIKDIEEGKTLKDILKNVENDREIQLILRHSKDLYSIYEKPREKKPLVFWIYGDTGTGKTTAVINYVKKRDGEDPYVLIAQEYKWWPGYDGRKYIILDDFRRSKCSFVELLSITQGVHRIEYKGNHRQLKAEEIYITCPDNPAQAFTYYNKFNEKWQVFSTITQLIRRIDKVIEFVYTDDLRDLMEMKTQQESYISDANSFFDDMTFGFADVEPSDYSGGHPPKESVGTQQVE